MANDPKPGQPSAAPPSQKAAASTPSAPAPQAAASAPAGPGPLGNLPAAPASTLAPQPTATSAEGSTPEIPSTQEERQLAMIAHLGGIIPFGGFLVPLGIWAVKMGVSPFVEDQAKEALNLQINVLMITILAAISCMIYIGFILLPAVLILNGVYCYMGGMAAKEGKVWRYPYNIRYIP